MKNTATHLGFTVSNIEETISFYTKLLRTEPSKVKRNYAKFELEEPAMVLSFLQSQTGKNVDWPNSGAHFGIRVSSSAEVDERFAELRASGIPLLGETDVACCYALQDKFWANDPDGIRWEIYAFLEDSEHNEKKDQPSQTDCCTEESKADMAVPCC